MRNERFPSRKRKKEVETMVWSVGLCRQRKEPWKLKKRSANWRANLGEGGVPVGPKLAWGRGPGDKRLPAYCPPHVNVKGGCRRH